MSYATPDDVAARWRALSDDESDVAQVLIDDLSDELDVHRPSLSAFLTSLLDSSDDAQVAKGTMLQRIVTKTIANAVKRALRNPDTLSSTNISADGGIAVGYDNAMAELEANAACLTSDDYAAIDVATSSAGGTAPGPIRSLQLGKSRPYGPRIVNMNCLPTA